MKSRGNKTMNDKKELYYVVLNEGIRVVKIKKSINKKEVLTNLIDKYGVELVSYHTNPYDAFENYYLNRKVFYGEDLDVKKATNQLCIGYLEHCLLK